MVTPRIGIFVMQPGGYQQIANRENSSGLINNFHKPSEPNQKGMSTRQHKIPCMGLTTVRFG